MDLNRFKKITSVEHGFVDWAESALGLAHPPRVEFYRGEIKKIVWSENLPRIKLHRIKKFFPGSNRWGMSAAKTSDFFDFQKLKKKGVRFASEKHPDGSIRFMIFFGVQGFILPQSRVPKKHRSFVHGNNLSLQKVVSKSQTKAPS